MTITKEQFETFNKHFNIIEITHETVQSTAYLDLEEFNEYQDHPDDFLLDTAVLHLIPTMTLTPFIGQNSPNHLNPFRKEN